MVNVSNATLFTAILSSGILSPYLEKDAGLAELMKDPNHPNIHYYQRQVSAKQITSVFKTRLEYMVSKRVFLNLEATKQLVAFIEEHSESGICGVNFSFPKHSYGVYLGITADDIHVICVMTGGHTSDTDHEIIWQ